MSVSLRTGQYGSYYGNTFNSSNALTDEQMKVNATYIYSYLTSKGWSINSIAALLGNMQYESSINPGRWQSDSVNVGPAYGLVQWDPFTKYTEWCTSEGYSDPSEMDHNLARIIYEVNNNIQYYSTDNYPESFGEFTHSTKDAYYLACAFAWNYERSWVVLYGTEEEKEALRQKRGNSANYWLEYLGGSPVNPPSGTTGRKRNKYNFILFNKRRRGIYG